MGSQGAFEGCLGHERRGELGTLAAFLSGDTAGRVDDIAAGSFNPAESETILARS
jgi:hypothetical protein